MEPLLGRTLQQVSRLKSYSNHQRLRQSFRAIENFVETPKTAQIVSFTVSNSKLFKDEVWYKSFRKYLESVQATGVLAGPDVEYYKQDQQYAKVKKSLPLDFRSY